MKWGWIIGFALLVTSCAPSRFVAPLEKGEHVLGGNFGGPLIGNAGPTIPMPLTAITYGYGFSERTSLYAGLHTTSLLFGTPQIEVGALREFSGIDSLRPWKPGWSGALSAHTAASFSEGDFRLWPQLTTNAYWQLGAQHNHMIYAGLNGYAELQKQTSTGSEIDQRILSTLQLGYQWQNKAWRYQIETAWVGIGRTNEKVVVDYTRMPGNNGAFGIYLSAFKTLNYGN